MDGLALGASTPLSTNRGVLLQTHPVGVRDATTVAKKTTIQRNACSTNPRVIEAGVLATMVCLVVKALQAGGTINHPITTGDRFEFKL